MRTSQSLPWAFPSTLERSAAGPGDHKNTDTMDTIAPIAIIVVVRYTPWMFISALELHPALPSAVVDVFIEFWSQKSHTRRVCFGRAAKVRRKRNAHGTWRDSNKGPSVWWA